MSITPPQPDAPHSAVEAYAAAVVEAAQQRAAGTLARGRTALTVLELGAAATSGVSELSEDSPQLARRACRSGCAWCCHLCVSVTPVEALLMAARLAETRSAAEFERIARRVAEFSQRVSHLTMEERAVARVPCALLGEQGECTIYDFRPIGCRGWTSFSAEACQRAFEAAESGHAASSDRVAHLAATATTEGLERGLRKAGLDAGHYEFHSALRTALETPGAAQRWAEGEPVFAACSRVRSARVLGPG